MSIEIPEPETPTTEGGPDATAARGEVTLCATCVPADGWMADGFGKYSFTFRNGSGAPASATSWTASWQIDGKQAGEQWGGDLDLSLPPGKETVMTEIARLPLEVVEQSRPDSALIAGGFAVKSNGARFDIPFRLPVPEAKLPEKTELLQGKHVGIELMPSRVKSFTSKDQTMQWLDRVYEAMQELTGCTPIEGKSVMIQECPEHPWFAYVDGAGKPIFMNTKRIPSVLEQIGRGIAPGGWVHEIGHFFDVLGKWYFWGSASVEWQANWKVCYAYEAIPDSPFKVVWAGHQNLAYCPGHEVLLDGRQWVDSYFLFTGDPYLADSSRTWDTLSSDELHSFFQRLVRVYGWEPFKRWYRTYARFEKMGLTEPKTHEGTIQLIAAILSKETDSDLVPIFQRWRMPVTKEGIESIKHDYPVDN